MVSKKAASDLLYRSRLYRESRSGVLAQKTRKGLVSVIRTLLLLGWSFVILYPLTYMVCLGIREPSDMLDPTVIRIPRHWTLQNFEVVFETLDYFSGLLRTAALSVSCSLLQTFSCAVAGYGSARFRFKGKNVLFFGALFSLIVPPNCINMPLYIRYIAFQEWSSVKMIDTLIPMLLPALFGAGLRAGLFIYVYRQFFKGLPKELEEAAYLDGCGPVSAFFRIMLMNAGAPLLTTFILSLVWYWNDFLNTALFFTSYQPLAVKMANYASALNEYCTPEVLLPYGELKLIAPSLIAAAERARVPVVVHYDHGLTFERCMEALQLGFTSVMFDGSAGGCEDNVRNTREMVRIAHAMGASVEGEIGHVGEAQSGDNESDDRYTTPQEAVDFVRATGVDALAVAIGTAHGAYRRPPQLDIRRLREIHAALDTPLVLHGGSGLSDDDFRSTVREGISKINIFTDLCTAGAQAMREAAASGADYLKTRTMRVEAIREAVRRKILLFGSAGTC